MTAIDLGADFRAEASQAAATCQVLIAIIGPAWLDVTGENGRLELEVALTHGARLFDEAVRMARSAAGEPQALSGLARLLAGAAAAMALSGIAQALIAADPDRAGRLFAEAARSARDIPSESVRASTLSGRIG